MRGRETEWVGGGGGWNGRSEKLEGIGLSLREARLHTKTKQSQVGLQIGKRGKTHLQGKG